MRPLFPKGSTIFPNSTTIWETCSEHKPSGHTSESNQFGIFAIIWFNLNYKYKSLCSHTHTVFCYLFFIFCFEICLTLKPQMTRNLPCGPGWPHTHENPPALFSWVPGFTGISHHALVGVCLGACVCSHTEARRHCWSLPISPRLFLWGRVSPWTATHVSSARLKAPVIHWAPFPLKVGL